MEHFFDSYAIIEIVSGNPNYSKLKEEIFITTTLNLSEVYYALLRQTNEYLANETLKKLNLQFIEITQEISIDAAKFRFKNKNLKLSYADCIGYIIALKNNMKFLTGDNKFKEMESVEFVK